jgi:hypothetical protein
MIAFVGSFDEVLEHFLGDVKIGDHPVLHGLDGYNVAGSPAQHFLGLMANGFNLSGVSIDGNNGGFVDDDSLSAGVNQGVGSAEIDCEIIGEETENRSEVKHFLNQLSRGTVDPLGLLSCYTEPAEDPLDQGRHRHLFFMKQGKYYGLKSAVFQAFSR